MKTTIDLPDELLAKARAVAAQRRTSLKSMIEYALRRELIDDQNEPNECDWVLNEHGFPVLKSLSPATVTSEQIYQLLEDEG